MADNFYTSVIQRGNYLLVREIKDGKRVSQKIRWRPTFYGPTNKKSNLKTLQGHTVGPVTLESITCLLYTSPSPRDLSTARMPSSA